MELLQVIEQLKQKFKRERGHLLISPPNAVPYILMSDEYFERVMLSLSGHITWQIKPPLSDMEKAFRHNHPGWENCSSSEYQEMLYQFSVGWKAHVDFVLSDRR